MTPLDEALIARLKRKSPADIPLNTRVAINLFWRRGVRVPALVKAFQVSRNPIYYQALTGNAPSYPGWAKGRETNKIIEKLGVEAAWARYVTPEMEEAVNQANRELLEEQDRD